MTKETIEKVLRCNLDLNQYFILSCIKKGEDILSLLNYRKVLGWKTLLQKKELLDENGNITMKGSLLLENIGNNEPIIKTSPKDILKEAAPVGERAIFRQWVKNLHKKLQDELIRLTGRKQKYLKLGGTNYSFLDGPLDLEDKLIKCMKRYGLTDLEKIEKLLIRHCKNESPLIKYYVLKDNSSPLATDYENFEDIKEEKELPKAGSGAVDI